MSTQLQEHAAQGQLLNDNAFEQLIQKEFKPKSKQAEDAVQEAVKTLAKQALTSVVQHSSDTYQTIEAIIAEIDKKLSDQINKIIHHEEFKQMESAWRGLHHLVNNTETNQMMKIKFMPLSKKELGRNLKKVQRGYVGSKPYL